MMKKVALAAAAVAFSGPALAADLYAPTPPPASSPVYSPTPMIVGHVELGIGALFDSSDTVGVATGVGRVNLPLGGTWNLELETGGGGLWQNSNGAGYFGTFAHLWTGGPGGAVGVFGGALFPPFGSQTTGVIGLEGKTDFNNITLGGQAAYNFYDGGDFWSVRGWADYYLNPNLAVTGEVTYLTGSGSDAWAFGLKAEHRHANYPISGWASVNYFTGSGADAWGLMIGGRAFMDAPGTTLEQHNKAVPFDYGLALGVF